jgi:hypothetical protein
MGVTRIRRGSSPTGIGGFPIWIGTVPPGGEAPLSGWEPSPPGWKSAHLELNGPHP